MYKYQHSLLSFIPRFPPLQQPLTPTQKVAVGALVVELFDPDAAGLTLAAPPGHLVGDIAGQVGGRVEEVSVAEMFGRFEVDVGGG